MLACSGPSAETMSEAAVVAGISHSLGLDLAYLIYIISVQENHDFIAITSDGIFDKMTNSEVISDIWNCGIVESKLNDLDPHILAGVIA